VLLLTLIVFNGPFLNLWLVVVDYACIEDGFSRRRSKTLVVIFGAQIAAIYMAHFFYNLMQNDWKSTITWTDFNISSKEANAHYYWPTMIEELIAVTSLLMGFLYLAWLRPEHKETNTPKIDIQFFLSLTLLVAACMRAFPTAISRRTFRRISWLQGK
jgi:glucan phosphoethanolaminetransferase (alkaline phosphatase superfamily)